MTERALNRFSQIYLFGGDQLQDSPRFRTRLCALYREVDYQDGSSSQINWEVQKLIHRECGIEITNHGKYSSVQRMLENAPMRDVLDTITLVWLALAARSSQWQTKWRGRWQQEVTRLFKEENLAYQLRDACVVNRFVDQEFHASTTSVIASLERPELAQVRTTLQLGMNRLIGIHQDTKGAVTATFEACEILAKILIPGTYKLNAALCKDKLLKFCVSPHAGAVERNVEAGVFDAMANWVDAVHNYRHGQGGPEPIAPGFELAVQLVSVGCSFIRRLALAHTASGPSQAT
jgi:hypothetical protein